MKALVTGGTGTLGRLVVPRLQAAGFDVRVLSRHSPEAAGGIEFMTGDLATGQGIEEAVAGTGIILHLAGGMKGNEDETRSLVQAASRAGTRHLVYISVVGADRIPIISGIDRAMFGYYGSKLAAEQVVADSGLPWTTLRATQFHESMVKLVQQMAKLPVIPVPAGWRFQPIDAAEVADRLVELALGTPSGLVPDIAGPRVRDGRDGPHLPPRRWQTSTDPAYPAPRQRQPRLPSRCQPGPGSGGRSPYVGRRPGRAGGLAEPEQIQPGLTAGTAVWCHHRGDM